MNILMMPWAKVCIIHYFVSYVLFILYVDVLIRLRKSHHYIFNHTVWNLHIAALLVASRIHDFNRSIKELIKVVKIGEGTIRKR